MGGYKYLLVLLVFLIGCVPQEPVTKIVPVVEKALVQCWDGSSVESLEACPQQKVEEKIDKVYVKRAEKTLMQQLIEKAPSDYWFNDGFFRVFVSGTKRSLGEYDQFWNVIYRLEYWDTASKTIYVLAPVHVKEYWWLQKQGINQSGGRSTDLLPAFFELHLSGNKEADKLVIPKEFNKYWFDAEEDELDIIIRPFYSKGPIDWMREYFEDVPVQIDNTTRLLSNVGSNFESNLSITYKNKDKTPLIVFRFDKRLGVPLVIDEMDEKGKLVKRNSFEFGVDYRDYYKTTKVTPKIVTLPENSIIISVKDYEEYYDAIG